MPDGKHVYVAGSPVSVIDTATNTVAATVTMWAFPIAVGIIPPPRAFPLSSTAPGINPLTEAVTLEAGSFAFTIPPPSFVKTAEGHFIFLGLINGASLAALIAPTGTLRYVFQTKAVRASFTGTTNPVPVTLTIGGDTGTTSVTAFIFH
jgi:YVTN family beta-propeller protein